MSVRKGMPVASMRASGDAGAALLKRGLAKILQSQSACKVPRTQRAWGDYARSTGRMTGAGPEQFDSMTPVLVVPEAAVKGCEHDDRRGGPASMVEHGLDCGSYRQLTLGCWTHWQRPRLLRVAREKKR